GVAGGLAAVVAVAEGAVGVEGHASVCRVAELGRREGVALGVRVVDRKSVVWGKSVGDGAGLGHGRVVAVGVRRVVDQPYRNRDGCLGAARAVGLAVGLDVGGGLFREGVAGGLAAVVAVAEGAVGVEGHASVCRVAELGRREGVALGVRV